MPQHYNDPYEEANRRAMLRAAELSQQQEQLAGQAPQMQRGFMEQGQEGIVDVLKNPSQGQVDALIGGLAGALNPRSSAPLISGAVGGLSALQQRRSQELQARQQQFEAQNEQLQNRIDSMQGLSEMAGRGSSIRSARDNLELGRDRQDLAEDKFAFEKGKAKATNYINPDTGEVYNFKEDQQGNLLLDGQPVDPGAAGLVPYDKEVFQAARGGKADASQKLSSAREFKSLIFDPKFPAAVGRFDLRRRAAETLGIGKNIEVLTKRTKQAWGDKLVQDLEKMGARPSDKDLDTLKSFQVGPNDDPEVWRSEYLNNVVPVVHRSIMQHYGEEAADAYARDLLEGIPPDAIQGLTLTPGTITSQILNAQPSTGDFQPQFQYDEEGNISGGTTSSGKRVRIIR